MTTREQVAEYQDKIRIFMALRDGNINLINDYKDCTSIDLSGCSSLQNVDGLVNCIKLTNLDLSSCGEFCPGGVVGCSGWYFFLAIHRSTYFGLK